MLLHRNFQRFARMPNFKLEVMDIIPVIKDALDLFVEENVEITFTAETKEAIVEADKFQLRRLIIKYDKEFNPGRSREYKFIT